LSGAGEVPEGAEQRRSPRFAMPSSGGAVSIVGARLLNVSLHGALIEAPLPMETEAVLPLRVVVAGSKLDIDARVAQCLAQPGGSRRTYRVGLEFLSPPEGFRERLAEALRGAAASPEAG
jgi:hypothetical protein